MVRSLGSPLDSLISTRGRPNNLPSLQTRTRRRGEQIQDDPKMADIQEHLRVDQQPDLPDGADPALPRLCLQRVQVGLPLPRQQHGLQRSLPLGHRGPDDLPQECSGKSINKLHCTFQQCTKLYLCLVNVHLRHKAFKMNESLQMFAIFHFHQVIFEQIS